jgi:hypothetical protein
VAAAWQITDLSIQIHTSNTDTSFTSDLISPMSAELYPPPAICERSAVVVPFSAISEVYSMAQSRLGRLRSLLSGSECCIGTCTVAESFTPTLNLVARGAA